MVRNFWLELGVDDRKTTIKTGPRSKVGGFSLDIYAKVDRKSEKIYQIEGFVNDEDSGALNLLVYDAIENELLDDKRIRI